LAYRTFSDMCVGSSRGCACIHAPGVGLVVHAGQRRWEVPLTRGDRSTDELPSTPRVGWPRLRGRHPELVTSAIVDDIVNNVSPRKRSIAR
ncbi:hypothetical protein, partial [Brachybacterium sp. 107]|uniref:hypothetical protein n=1 Tax=Brachybacterium sp. 107 TaxID=3457736 RepID=UPI004034E757